MFRYLVPVMAALWFLSSGCGTKPPSTQDRTISHPLQPGGTGVLKVCTEWPPSYTAEVESQLKAVLPLLGKTEAEADLIVKGFLSQQPGGTKSGEDLNNYMFYICQMSNNGNWSEATTERLINRFLDKWGGGQPLGKEKFLEALMADIQGQSRQLSELEEAAKTELALPGENLLVRFPPPLNTTTFNSMRVAYPKEFLE
jgi:hypothetical protein